MAAKRGKRPGLRARSKNARTVKKQSKSVAKRLAAQHQATLPLSIMERAELEGLRVALADANVKLHMCRKVMETNDPGNARTIFGPPLDEPQSGSADAEGGTPENYPPEGVFTESDDDSEATLP